LAASHPLVSTKQDVSHFLVILSVFLHHVNNNWPFAKKIFQAFLDIPEAVRTGANGRPDLRKVACASPYLAHWINQNKIYCKSSVDHRRKICDIFSHAHPALRLSGVL
jgi:hypothetical protein